MKTKVIIEFTERWIKAEVLNQPKKTLLESVEADNLDISRTLSRILQQIKQKNNLEVIAVLSRDRVILRHFDLPSHDPSEIKQMLGLHVVRQVTLPKEEIVWGYQNLGFDGLNSSSILLAVAQRLILKNIFNAFVSQNILPEVTLMSSQGVVHYVENYLKSKSLAQQTYLILDLDYNFSDLILVNNQSLRSSVVISHGAEKLKTADEKAKFAAELKQALMVFNNEIPGRQPSRLFITGARVEIIPFIETQISKDFSLRPEFIGTQPNENFSFTALDGFGCTVKKEDIDFVIPELQIKKEVKQKVKQLLIMGVCLTYVFILSGALVLLRISQLQAYRAKLDAQVAALRKDTGGLFDLAQKINIVRQYVNPKQSAITYCYELTRNCPSNITITNFIWEGPLNFTIRGYAAQLQDVFNFAKSLNELEMFKGAQTKYTRRRKSKEAELVDFEIALK
jgi:hypothetical protein